MEYNYTIPAEGCLAILDPEKYYGYIDQYTELLEELYTYQKDKEYELVQLKNLTAEASNIHHDMKRSHQKTKIEKQLREMERTKKELIDTIQNVKTKNENLIGSFLSLLTK